MNPGNKGLAERHLAPRDKHVIFPLEVSLELLRLGFVLLQLPFIVPSKKFESNCGASREEPSM